MFGSIGGPEVILLFIAALLLFGPRRLPEIGRTLGKTIADFRRATNEFKTNLEREVRMDELKDAVRPIESAASPETLARGVLLDVITPVTPEAAVAPAVPAAPAEAESPATLEANPEIDGGPGSVH